MVHNVVSLCLCAVVVLIPKFCRKGKVRPGTKFIKNLYFSTMQAPDCLNCGLPLVPEQNFCSNCSQKSVVHRLSLHDVGHDAMHYFTHADKGIFSLLWHLLKRPGQVQREYVAGKRKKYFPPLNFFLLVAAIYVFMINIISPATRENIISKQEQARFEKITDPEKKANVAMILDRRVKASQFINKYSNVVAMIATPLISFFFWLFYLKGRYNYTEHLVANLYISGFTVLSFAFVFGPVMKLLHLEGLNIILVLYFIFEICYRAISYYNFMHRRTTGSAVKAVLVSTAVIIIWFLVTFILMFAYILNGFWGLLH
jgi:hypothetical protein